MDYLPVKDSRRRTVQRQQRASVALLLLGYALGNLCPLASIITILRQRSTTTAAPHSTASTHQHGSMWQLETVPQRPTSHTDATGRAITKQQLIEPFSVVDNLAGISVATLDPGQIIVRHEHASMHEFFYVLQGHGDITVEDQNQQQQQQQNNNHPNHHRKYSAKAGTFVHVAPGEVHELVASQQHADEPLIFLNVGITTGPKEG